MFLIFSKALTCYIKTRFFRKKRILASWSSVRCRVEKICYSSQGIRILSFSKGGHWFRIFAEFFWDFFRSKTPVKNSTLNEKSKVSITWRFNKNGPKEQKKKIENFFSGVFCNLPEVFPEYLLFQAVSRSGSHSDNMACSQYWDTISVILSISQVICIQTSSIYVPEHLWQWSCLLTRNSRTRNIRLII